MWVKRILIGSGVAVASMLMVPTVAGAANTASVCPQTFTEPSCVTPPAVVGTTKVVAPTPAPDGPAPAATTVSASSTSLPFTGADVEELAILGVGAIAVGGVLVRRRRRMSA
jgi:LPXTG-motif cell wall-anchored protein